MIKFPTVGKKSPFTHGERLLLPNTGLADRWKDFIHSWASKYYPVGLLYLFDILAFVIGKGGNIFLR